MITLESFEIIESRSPSPPPKQAQKFPMSQSQAALGQLKSGLG